MEENFENKVFYYKDCLRANLDTSGLDIDFMKLPARNKNIDMELCHISNEKNLHN